MFKRKIFLISDNREFYWFCLRKLSHKCEVIHSSLKEYRQILSVYETSFISCVILDTSNVDSDSAKSIRLFAAENFDCPFFTVNSEDLEGDDFLSEIQNLYFAPQEEKLLTLESPMTLFSGDRKKTESDKNYMELIEKYAAHDMPVLLLGETGCGKTYAAEIIHNLSSRKGKPFVYTNIAALNPALIEAELFGCVKGAYTDAVEKKGLFEEAAGGTLCIDEFGELSLQNQVMFHGVLDKKKFCRVGSTKEIDLKCRLIFATDADLLAMTKNHTFKKPLYWRLDKFVIKIPPLRERRDEIAPLAKMFAKSWGKTLSEDAIAFLEAQRWEGNIRQLKDCIERSAILTEGPVIYSKDLIL